MLFKTVFHSPFQSNLGQTKKSKLMLSKNNLKQRLKELKVSRLISKSNLDQDANMIQSRGSSQLLVERLLTSYIRKEKFGSLISGLHGAHHAKLPWPTIKLCLIKERVIGETSLRSLPLVLIRLLKLLLSTLMQRDGTVSLTTTELALTAASNIMFQVFQTQCLLIKKV